MINKNEALGILKEMQKMFPDAECELLHSNAFELTIAVMLSAQTTDAGVNKITKKLFSEFKAPKDYLCASTQDLEKILKPIGMQKIKADNLKKMCGILQDEFNNEVPSTYEQLIELPGVGRKTANVILSTWFNEPRIAVDTHVARVAKRLKFANSADSVITVEENLMELLPKKQWCLAHHTFIFFGRYHCTAKKPKCYDCPLYEKCAYNEKSQNL